MWTTVGSPASPERRGCRLGDLPDLRFRSIASTVDVDDFRIDNRGAECWGSEASRLARRSGRGLKAAQASRVAFRRSSRPWLPSALLDAEGGEVDAVDP